MGMPTTAMTRAVDVEQVRRFATMAFAPEQHVEIRGCSACRDGRARSRILRGNGHRDIARTAVEFAAAGLQVYYTLNPLRELADAGKAARDADVASRRWLLIDVDPTRPANTSATVGEKLQAFSLARWVCHWLAASEWPQPAAVGSGNGYHLLYRIQLANDPEARDLVQRLLRGLAANFVYDGAAIDTTVYNASRISKLPGTWACKGTDTAERPHRLARLLGEGSGKCVSAEMIRAVCADLPLPEPVRVETKPRKMRGKPASKEARALAYLSRLPGGVEGQCGSRPCYWAARVLCWGFGFAVEDAVSLLLTHYSPKCVPPWSEREIRHKCEDAASRPFSKPFGWMENANVA